MLEKYKKFIIIGMLVLIPVGILEMYFIPEYKPNPDLPVKYFEVNYQIQNFSVFASTATLTSNLIKA